MPRLFLLLLLFAGGCAQRTPDLDALFESSAPTESTFVVVGEETGEVFRYHPGRADMGFRPASTFKIANTLIGLETGVVPGRDFALDLDPAVVDTTGFFPQSWRGRQTLDTAFRHSVVWFYQEVARRIGAERMQAWVSRFGYGNEHIGDAIDTFWLRGDLRISPNEQVAFLERVMTGGYDVSPRAVEILREIMLLETTDTYRLYGKTGTSEITPTRENAWLVGFVETDRERSYYALNLEGESVWEDWPPQARAELVKRLLAAAGVIEAG